MHSLLIRGDGETVSCLLQHPETTGHGLTDIGIHAPYSEVVDTYSDVSFDAQPGLVMQVPLALVVGNAQYHCSHE